MTKRRDDHGVLPHVWTNQRVSPQQGPCLSVGQVGSGLAIHSQDEVADAQSAVAADGPPLDDAADQHPWPVLHGANCHPCKGVYNTHKLTSGHEMTWKGLFTDLFRLLGSGWDLRTQKYLC